MTLITINGYVKDLNKIDAISYFSWPIEGIIIGIRATIQKAIIGHQAVLIPLLNNVPIINGTIIFPILNTLDGYTTFIIPNPTNLLDGHMLSVRVTEVTKTITEAHLTFLIEI